MSEKSFSVEISREAGYRMRAVSGRDDPPTFLLDEAPPLGEGAAATPTELLAAAVGGCLSASLIFCMEKSRIPVEGIRTRVEGTLERNEQGRLRVGGLKVILDYELPEEMAGRSGRCLELFEDFCIVKESVRQGIPIEVEVRPSAAPIPVG